MVSFLSLRQMTTKQCCEAAWIHSLTAPGVRSLTGLKSRCGQGCASLRKLPARTRFPACSTCPGSLPLPDSWLLLPSSTPSDSAASLFCTVQCPSDSLVHFQGPLQWYSPPLDHLGQPPHLKAHSSATFIVLSPEGHIQGVPGSKHRHLGQGHCKYHQTK